MSYSATEVATLSGASVRQIQGYVRAGFLSPQRDGAGRLRFGFQDLVLLRTARGLVAARLGATRVKRALSRLKQQLPPHRPLSGVALVAQGGRLLVRDGDVRWEPESGQALLDFGGSDPTADAPGGTLCPLRTVVDASSWYELGCAREDAGDPNGAARAYRQALWTDEAHLDSLVNLGRLLHERGEREEALVLCRRAVELSAEHAIAAYNLGVMLEETADLDAAQSAYELALQADPGAADAHYNLAGLLERRGDRAAALRHLLAYKRLTGR